MKTSVIYAQSARETYKNSGIFRGFGFLIITTILLLLPYERLILPFNTKIVDFVLIMIILFSAYRLFFVYKYVHLPLIWPIWMILLASMVATMFGMMHLDSYVAIIKDLYIFIWFLALANVLIQQSFDDLDLLMKIWCLIALIVSITSILGMLGLGPKMFYTSAAEELVISSGKFNRAIGTYLNPNALAVYLSVSLFLLLATNWTKFIRFLMSVLILAGIFATGSLGAMVATLGSLFILFGLNKFLKTKNSPKLWSLTFVLGIILFLVLLIIVIVIFAPLNDLTAIPPNKSDIFMITLGRLPRSFSSRMFLIQQAWPIYSQFPLGTGPETFDTLTGELHNDYIAYLFERGPLGLLGWLGIIGTVLFTAIHTAYMQTDDHYRWQILSFGMGFLACAVNAFSHEVSHFRQMWVFIAFLFAIRYHIAKQNERSKFSNKMETMRHNDTYFIN